VFSSKANSASREENAWNENTWNENTCKRKHLQTKTPANEGLERRFCAGPIG
jgi:hypothetical protein